MDCKEEIIKMIQKCNNLHWLKSNSCLCFKIVGVIRGAADCCPIANRK